jgi:hypothetical protein
MRGGRGNWRGRRKETYKTKLEPPTRNVKTRVAEKRYCSGIGRIVEAALVAAELEVVEA